MANTLSNGQLRLSQVAKILNGYGKTNNVNRLIQNILAIRKLIHGRQILREVNPNVLRVKNALAALNRQHPRNLTVVRPTTRILNDELADMDVTLATMLEAQYKRQLTAQLRNRGEEVALIEAIAQGLVAGISLVCERKGICQRDLRRGFHFTVRQGIVYYLCSELANLPEAKHLIDLLSMFSSCVPLCFSSTTKDWIVLATLDETE